MACAVSIRSTPRRDGGCCADTPDGGVYTRAVDSERFEHHLTSPRGRGTLPGGGADAGAADGVAGTKACGDVVRFGLALSADGTRVADAGYVAEGCGATLAAGSAAVELVAGAPLLDVARVGAREIAGELGGLSPGKLHAAELVADALARALGTAAHAHAALPAAGRTLVAMSGGVDSAVAALLCAWSAAPAGASAAAAPASAAPLGDRALARGPFGDRALAGDPFRDAVLAVTVELWADEANDGERSCCSAQAVRVARGLAHRMGIPHFTLDLRAPFRAGVVDPYLSEHAGGLTPNPCIRCNGRVRLDAMLTLARGLGADALATGHYARTAEHGDPAGPLLRAAADPAKDQAYMLSAVEPDTLAQLRFPLGELTKPEVRRIAAEAQLPVASKQDSQDLCFLAGTSRAAFLRRHGGIGEREGEIVDRTGRVLGRHRGHHAFTVGQRRGLGLGAPQQLYVLATDAHTNRVVVGSREELETTRVALRGLRLHRDGARVDRVKLRYRSKAIPARLLGAPAAGAHRHAELQLDEPVDGAAPGQLACLLDGELVVGWATIVAPAPATAAPAPNAALAVA
jgi:tRNA-uridine 2-sulfurtransferase